RELLSTRLGVAVSRPLLVRIAEATDGNPFYALELTRVLAARGELDDPTVALPLPDRLHDLVAERIAALDPAAATACLVVAALAQPSVELLLAATESPTWAASGAAAAEDAGVIALEGTAIRFTHPLLRSAVYDAALPSARRTVHARLASLVDDAAERARHLAQSVAGSDPEVAAALDAGVRHAWDRGARNVAAQLAERALALTPVSEPRNQRRLAAAAYQYEAANPTRSRTLLAQVLDDDPTRGERLEAICRLGSVRYYEGSFERSRGLLSAALAELDEHEHGLRARLETELAYTLIARGDYGAAETHGEAAIAAARAAGDVALERAAAAPLGWASLWAGHGVRTELVELCLSGADLPEPFAVEPRMQAAAVLKWGDQLDRARSVLTDLYELAEARAAVAKLPLLAWQIADLEVLGGRWEVAERLADEAVEGSRFRAGMAVAMCTGLRARVHALRGRLEAARADVAEASAAARELGGIAAMAATDAAVLLETCRGDPVGVHSVAGPLVADLDAIPPTDPAFLRWVPDEVEALVALGEAATAAEVLEWFEGRCRATGRRSGWAAAHRCRALLAGDSGAVDEAVEHIVRSVDLFAEVGMPFERARTLLVAGGLHRRGRHRGPAASALQEARATFDGLGARGWAQRAAAGLERLGAIRTGYAEGGKLTLAEEHVARLVAAGLRNREVAAKLFVSPKTVESQLTCIYRKLGVRSRTELAAALAHREPANAADPTAEQPSAAPDRTGRED
ncbi:MAG TPA: LuxR C-terminal-related transcriptional regulator, partial [Mycobacteriales bacterium]|nr:LuxR C-terminal-related transcriptional regulator [Mycobacteriales bacterium]